MPKIAETGLISVLIVLAFSAGGSFAAENRVPTPEEFKEAVRQYRQSGNVMDSQRSRQVPKAVEQFNRALSLHTRKEASARDLKEAASLYQEAYDGGVPQAATNLALLYLEGKGVKKDAKKALSLLNAAAAKNDSQADIALARLYLNGIDVKKDEKKGEALLNKAAKAGNQNAAKMLGEYKDWKKKNEIAMKQYQDLMKQVQAAQNKQNAVPQPLQIFPRSPRVVDSRFPVIPGSSYLMAHQAPMPSFIDLLSSQPPVLKVIPEGNAGFQPVKVEVAQQPAPEKPVHVGN
jgi:hypothetical protein